LARVALGNVDHSKFIIGNFDVLLTVRFSIFILVNNQLDALNLF